MGRTARLPPAAATPLKTPQPAQGCLSFLPGVVSSQLESMACLARARDRRWSSPGLQPWQGRSPASRTVLEAAALFRQWRPGWLPSCVQSRLGACASTQPGVCVSATFPSPPAARSAARLHQLLQYISCWFIGPWPQGSQAWAMEETAGHIVQKCNPCCPCWKTGSRQTHFAVRGSAPRLQAGAVSQWLICTCSAFSPAEVHQPISGRGREQAEMSAAKSSRQQAG